MVVKCESCKAELSDKNLSELEDKDKKLHVICTDCKKQAKMVEETFGAVEWEAFVKFVNRPKEEMKMSGPDIPVSKK